MKRIKRGGPAVSASKTSLRRSFKSIAKVPLTGGGGVVASGL